MPSISINEQQKRPCLKKKVEDNELILRPSNNNNSKRKGHELGGSGGYMGKVGGLQMIYSTHIFFKKLILKKFDSLNEKLLFEK